MAYADIPTNCCFRFDLQTTDIAVPLARANAGSRMAKSMAMTAMTVSSSISVKGAFLSADEAGRAMLFFFMGVVLR